MKKVKAYKVFNSDWTCNNFQYEVGKTYSIKGKPIMCEIGFHACIKVQDCFSYYSFDPDNKVAEVELSGIILGLDGEKQCAQKITIIKELKWSDMLVLVNTGKGNSGHRNSGNSNSGNSNSGDFNSTAPDIINCFNKPCKREEWDNAPKPGFIYKVEINIWIWWNDMSDTEKKANKDAFVTDGYLKVIDYKEAWKIAYDEASKEDIRLLKALPNFDAEVFKEITGIKIK